MCRDSQQQASCACSDIQRAMDNMGSHLRSNSQCCNCCPQCHFEEIDRSIQNEISRVKSEIESEQRRIRSEIDRCRDSNNNSSSSSNNRAIGYGGGSSSSYGGGNNNNSYSRGNSGDRGYGGGSNNYSSQSNSNNNCYEYSKYESTSYESRTGGGGSTAAAGGNYGGSGGYGGGSSSDNRLSRYDRSSSGDRGGYGGGGSNSYGRSNNNNNNAGALSAYGGGGSNGGGALASSASSCKLFDQAELESLPKVRDDGRGGKTMSIDFDLPKNVDPDKLKVTCTDGEICVSAEDQCEDRNTKQEYSYYKKTTLPPGTDPHALKCFLERGSHISITGPVNENSGGRSGNGGNGRGGYGSSGGSRQIPIEYNKRC